MKPSLVCPTVVLFLTNDSTNGLIMLVVIAVIVHECKG